MQWHVPDGDTEGHEVCDQLLDEYRSGCCHGGNARMAQGTLLLEVFLHLLILP